MKDIIEIKTGGLPVPTENGLYRVCDSTGRYWKTIVVEMMHTGWRWRWEHAFEWNEPDFVGGLLYGPLRHGWIPVAWGLPGSEQVLCLTATGERNTGYYSNSDEWFFDYDGMERDVTHWQPLPELPFSEEFEGEEASDAPV